MTSIIWLAVLGVAGGCLVFVLDFYAKTVATKMVSLYLEYDSAYYLMQQSLEEEASLVEELICGEYSQKTILYIEEFKKHYDERIKSFGFKKINSDDYVKKYYPGYPYSDADAIRHRIRMYKLVQGQQLRNLTESWTKMITLSSKAWIVEQSTVIGKLESLLIESEKVSFTIPAYDESGLMANQPSAGSSLHWELKMLFEEGRIPLKKNYKNR